MDVLILGGGQGLRIRESAAAPPKPLHTIGGVPIIMHIMSRYAQYGHNRFIIATGFAHDAMANCFAAYCEDKDQLDYQQPSAWQFQNPLSPDITSEVILVNTGLETATGSRLRALLPYVESEHVMMTYCDGLSNVDFSKLSQFHDQHTAKVTLTAVQPPPRFGELDIADNSQVTGFYEKNRSKQRWVNGGFFMIHRDLLSEIPLGENISFEEDVLTKVALGGELMAYSHDGFWACMDNRKEQLSLEQMWVSKQVPWLQG